ncbi:MAG: tail fiber protein [Acidobacteriota bacterium]
MADQFLGEIRIFGCNFAPYGWALCAGQILSISQNTALFSLLGTYYGGNGTSTFGLPNLQGNMAVNYGNGAGLSPYVLGETGGSATVNLITSEMPQHSHSFPATTAAGRVNIPGTTSAFGGVARGAAGPYTTTTNTTFAVNSTNTAGGNQPHNNMMPSLALNYCIALTGIFPARN